jgi:hypothetical protein
MKNPNRFYTYAYLRENRTPYYIGKGQSRRLYKKSKGEVRTPKDKSRIIFLKQNLTEEEAFKHEIYMISVFGRKDLGTGILHNKTDGGEGVSGHVLKDEIKQKIRKANIGKKHTEESKRKMSELAKFRKHTEETKKKIGEASKGRKSMLGKKMSEETKKKIREVNLGRRHTEESRKKMSDAHKGRIYRPLTEDHKKKLSQSNKGRIVTDQIKNKISNSLCKKTYKLITPLGKEIVLKNITKFCKENNLSLSSMRKVIYGKQDKPYKGWTGQVLEDVV